jgi:hypothetical protein
MKKSTQQSHGVRVGIRLTASGVRRGRCFNLASGGAKEVVLVGPGCLPFRALLVAHLELYWGTKPSEHTSFSSPLAVDERTSAEVIQTTRPGRSKQAHQNPDAPLLSRAWRAVGKSQRGCSVVFGLAGRLCYTVQGPIHCPSKSHAAAGL